MSDNPLPATPLASQEIESLRQAGWALCENDTVLEKTFTFPSFLDAIAFMTRLAPFCEAIDHHPDWTNLWRKVTVRLSTHDTGTLTHRDIQLARRMESEAYEATP
jgi:4a-hydroxytetrahydrobiopterin dehydratase